MFRRICAVFLIIFLTAGFIGLVWGEKNLSLGETDTYGEFRYQMMATGEGVEITGYTGTSSVVEIPADIEGEPVVSIGLRAFKGKGLTGVIIPDSVTWISEEAFSNNQLTTVTIPDSVTNIGSFAFICNQLSSLMIPNSITDICNCAFSQNRLTTISIPDSVTNIGSYAFSHNRLTSLTIPDSVINIGNYAFYDNQLTTIAIPDSVTNIGRSAFSSNQLTSITIPDSVAVISMDVFNSNRLTSVTIPDSVTEIGPSAFRNNQLTSISIPDSVTYIGWGAFANNKLTSVFIPDSVTEIAEGLFLNNQLTSVTIPKTVTYIYSTAFDGNQGHPANLTIRGERETEAERFAQEKGYTFKEIDLNNIKLVSTLENINVALGITRNELDLPREVEVTLVDKTKLNLGIQWDNGTPEYDADIPGEYFFIGNLILVEGVINTNNLVAWVKVIIAVGDANTISLSANPSDGGIVSGGGLYAPGKAITVKATPKEGYTFTNWEEDGEEVSQDSHYSFTVTADRCLVANFAEVEVPVIEPVVISPENIYFNKNHPATVILNIRWGSANRILGITGKAMGGALSITLEENKHYTVTDFDDGTAALNISPNFTALLPVPITMVPDGTELLLNIAFNTGETKEVIFRVISELSYISTVSVSIDNHPNARPQSGLNEADMVYETAVAPGITRFLAVFDLNKPVDKIGPVRSARTHLVQLASDHRGAFAHCGGSPDSFNFISRSPLMDFDEIYGSGSYFFRSTAGQIAPYNLYTSTGLINRGIVERGGTVSESIGYTRGDMPGGKAESQISVQFPGQDYEIDYIWNVQNQNYERSEKGNRLVLDDESIVTANNIVVIYAPHEQMYRQDIREWVIDPNIMGAGKACFYRDGKEWHGEWTKQSLSSSMSFMVNGEPFKFAPGNIWVLVVPKRHYEVELTSGWNTLSIPLKLEKDTISEIVDVSNIDIIYAYDSMNKRWIEADAGMRLHPMDAIYIKANNNNISPAKLIPYNDLSIGYTKQINKGWNLIGPALNIGSMDGYKMEANRVLASLNNKYSQVISQNVGNQFGWVYVNGDWRAPYMFAGKGYWVYALEDTELAGFSSTPVNAIYEGTNIYPYPPSGGGGGGGGGSSPVEPTTNLSQNVSAIPELPIAFFGSVNFENGDAVSEGTIDVLIDGNVIASKNFTNGQYGLSLGDRLIVEEMYFHYADMVQFRVNGMNAVHETIIDWSSGKLQELNLVASQDYERLFYQYLKIRTPNTVEIIFNQAIANNLKNDSELKKEILFTNDGINYRTLSEQDIIEINDNKLIIRFFENLSGSQNRIRIAAHAFKDREGSLLNEEVITNTFEARVIDECFIATAAFGSKLTPAVSLLRQFRDTKLLTNKAGTAFVNYYYTNSPKIAEIIANNEGLRLVVRILLLPIIAFVWMIMNAKIALVILILLAFYMIITNRARFLGVFRRS